MFVPHHEWLEERTALSRANDQLDRAESQQRKDREEISRLQSRMRWLEDDLSSVKATLFASIAKKVANKPLTGVPAHPPVTPFENGPTTQVSMDQLCWSDPDIDR